MLNFSKLETKLNIIFNNKSLIKQAFTHRSYINENPGAGLKNNERLEFLGDAVLELVVTDYLFRHYSNDEGDLTSWRAALVNTVMLSNIAKSLGFNDYLMLSKGEANDIGKARDSILADTFEAVVGAIYIDQSYGTADKFIHRNIIKKLSLVLEKKLYIDSKSSFQEKAQERAGITPDYKVLREWGPDHAKEFEIGVFLNNKLIAKAVGRSKQAAQEKAAKKALKKI